MWREREDGNSNSKRLLDDQAHVGQLDIGPEGLVSGSTTHLGSLLLAARPLLHLMTLLAAKSGAGNTLISVGSLLNGHFLALALSTAAAGADEPEEARGNGEGDTKPQGGSHAGAHIDVNVVGVKSCPEDTSQGAVGRRCGDCGANSEDGLGLKQMGQ